MLYVSDRRENSRFANDQIINEGRLAGVSFSASLICVVQSGHLVELGICRLFLVSGKSSGLANWEMDKWKHIVDGIFATFFERLDSNSRHFTSLIYLPQTITTFSGEFFFFLWIVRIV